MIAEVDQALHALVQNDETLRILAQTYETLRQHLPTDAADDTELDVAFDAPTKDWAARRNATTVNLYLYDMREDLRRRELGFEEEHGPAGQVVARRPSPRYFKLSYLVTAWTKDPKDEHHMLDALLRLFLRYDALPRELVAGTLAETRLDVPITVGLPPPEDRAFADVWSALGGELKPSLDIVVIAPINTGIVYDAAKIAAKGTHVDMSNLVDKSVDERRHRPLPPPLRSAGGPAAVPGATGPPDKPKRRRRG